MHNTQLTHGFKKLMQCLCFALFFIPQTVVAQQVNWTIRSPMPGAMTTTGTGLLVSVDIDEQYSFSTTDPVVIYLDGRVITGNVKINRNKLHMLYLGVLHPGRHKVAVEAFIEQIKKTQRKEWEFVLGSGSAGSIPVADTSVDTSARRVPAVNVSGSLVMDSRNEFLSGSGQDLRQEPPETRTISLDAAIRYKNALIPIRFFATSNNADAIQSMNYLQLGFINKWLEVEVGDLNPNMDQLILTGVRVRGAKTMFKYKKTSLQLYYGRMNEAYEGSIEEFIPGTGSLPANLVNDSQYINPGIYKRMMMAGRLEQANREETFKIGLNAFRATDDTGSIEFGAGPKQNIAGSLDFVLKLFKKAVTIQTAVASSVITHDISNGVIDEKLLDSLFKIKLPFDPEKYEDIIILNSSTVPTSVENADYLSYFGRLNYVNKYQSFSFEYRKNGPLFTSLGNPFLRYNYQGFSIGDKFSVYKKKFIVGLNYQDYSNDLNNTLPTKVYTKSYKANLFVNLKRQWPTVFFNYLLQDRNGKSDFSSIPNIDDRMSNFLVNIGYGTRFWGIGHHFSLMFNVTDRKDLARLGTHILAYNTMLGITESISERHSIQASFGKTIIEEEAGAISDLSLYNLSYDWQIKPQKYIASFAVSNVNTLATTFSNQSNRMSLIGKFGYRFLKSMQLDMEGGYQPFRDETVSINNYDESYIYLRYTTDLVVLFDQVASRF